MKLIKLPQTSVDQAKTDFEERVNAFRTRMEAGRAGQKFDFTFSMPDSMTVPEELKATLPRPRITMSPTTYLKMLTYVLKIEVNEVAWHGYVTRHPGHHYEITDVVLYPQKVSGAYVESNSNEKGKMEDNLYQMWMNERSLEEYGSIRFQAHSHVKMGVTPSGTDIGNQKEFMNTIMDGIEALPASTTPEQLEAARPFYIFAIMNQHQALNWFLYDFQLNVLFENAELDFIIDGFELPTIQAEITANIVNRYTPSHGSHYSTHGSSQAAYWNNTHNRGRGYHQTGMFPGEDDYDTDDSTYDPTRYGHRGSGSRALTTVSDKIWEIELSTKEAAEDFFKSEWYDLHKASLIKHQHTALKKILIYAVDDAAAGVINFEGFKESQFYLRLQGCMMREIDRPNWYPPKHAKPCKAPKNRKADRLRKLEAKILGWVDKEHTPYILIDSKMEKFAEVTLKYKNVIDAAGEILEIEFTDDTKKKCFLFTNCDFLEDEILECIADLQSAGFAFRSVKLEGGK